MSTKFLAPIYRFVSEWKNLNFTKCPKNLQPINLTWLWGSPLGQNFHAVRATPSISQSRIRLIRCFNYYFNPPPSLLSPMIWSSAFASSIENWFSLCYIELSHAGSAGPMMLCKLLDVEPIFHSPLSSRVSIHPSVMLTLLLWRRPNS